MATQPLWYTRRGKEVRGPFPEPLIGRYILLGRIQDGDELSQDQHAWEPVARHLDLIPEELKADLTDPAAQERLRLARRREDERLAGDRRQQQADAQAWAKRRSGQERRREEDFYTLKRREARTQELALFRQRHPRVFLLGSGLMLVLTAVVALGVWLTPSLDMRRNSCQSEPAPGVDWNNCRLEGAQLAGQGLAGARIGNAMLSGADLTGAQLTGAYLAYSNLAGARLSQATLLGANLLGGTLRNADLRGADLRGANLSYAILQGANLTDANLKGANLTNADLTGATLERANWDLAVLANTRWVDQRVCAPNSVGRCLPGGH